jgi:hypothetical protein
MVHAEVLIAGSDIRLHLSGVCASALHGIVGIVARLIRAAKCSTWWLHRGKEGNWKGQLLRVGAQQLSIDMTMHALTLSYPLLRCACAAGSALRSASQLGTSCGAILIVDCEREVAQVAVVPVDCYALLRLLLRYRRGLSCCVTSGRNAGMASCQDC